MYLTNKFAILIFENHIIVLTKDFCGRSNLLCFKQVTTSSKFSMHIVFCIVWLLKRTRREFPNTMKEYMKSRANTRRGGGVDPSLDDLGEGVTPP